MTRVLLLYMPVFSMCLHFAQATQKSYGSVVRIAPSVRDSVIATHCDGCGCRLVVGVGVMVGFLARRTFCVLGEGILVSSGNRLECGVDLQATCAEYLTANEKALWENHPFQPQLLSATDST